MVDVIEAALDIGVQYILGFVPNAIEDCSDRIVG